MFIFPRAVRAISIKLRRSSLARIDEQARVVVLSLAILFTGGLSLFAAQALAGDVVVEHAWSRATPAGARVAGGFALIRNEGSEADRLVAVASEISERGEVHEMGVDDKGVMTMRPLADGLEVPAGATVELKPGSYHLMFLGLKSRPKEGESFAATLSFEKAGDVSVTFEVTGMGGGHGGHGMKKGGHGNHDG